MLLALQDKTHPLEDLATEEVIQAQALLALEGAAGMEVALEVIEVVMVPEVEDLHISGMKRTLVIILEARL